MSEPESPQMITFSDLAIYFSEDEWALLDVHQKELYRNIMKDNYDTLKSLGIVTVKPGIISEIEGQESASCNLQDVVVLLTSKAGEPACDHQDCSHLLKNDKGEAPSVQGFSNSMDRVRITREEQCTSNREDFRERVTEEVKTKELTETYFRYCQDSVVQALIEGREEQSAMNRQDTTDQLKMKGEEQSTKVMEHSLERVRTAVWNGTSFVDCLDVMDQAQIEKEQEISVWDVQDSMELVMINREKQSTRDLEDSLDKHKNSDGGESSFLQISIGQEKIEEREELLTRDLRDSCDLVKIKTEELRNNDLEDSFGTVKTMEVMEPTFRDSNGQAHIEERVASSASYLQDSVVEGEAKESKEPCGRLLQGSLDQIKIEEENVSNDLQGSVDGVNVIKGKKTSAEDLQHPKVRVKMKKATYSLSTVNRDSLNTLNIKREHQSTGDIENIMEQVKANGRESSFDCEGILSQAGIEGIQEPFTVDHQDYFIEVEIEGEESYDFDLQGPMILIKQEEELSVGAEYVISTSEKKPRNKYKKRNLEKSEHVEPSDTVSGQVTRKTIKGQNESQREPRSTSGERLEPTNELQRDANQQPSSIWARRLRRKKRPHQCAKCSKRFVSHYTLSMHLKTHTDEGPHACDICLRFFRTRTRLLVHQKTHKWKREHVCRECGVSFSQESSLCGHLEMHAEERSRTDIERGQSFSDAAAVTTHKGTKVVVKPKVCSECGKGFTNKKDLASHRQEKHATVKPNICNMCGKGFKLELNLLRHQQTHVGEKNLTCEQCGESFRWQTQLSNHQRLHVREKWNTCDECGEGFSTSQFLATHKLSHAGENPYLCGECGQSFSDPSSFITHHKTHSFRKNYDCPECGRCFLNRGHFERHYQSHRGWEGQCTCPECGKGFSRCEYLSEHVQIHPGLCRYVCGECKKGFYTPKALNTHELKHRHENKDACNENENSECPILSNRKRSGKKAIHLHPMWEEVQIVKQSGKT